MSSFTPTCHGRSIYDRPSTVGFTSLRLTPIPREKYQCPVSTPARYLPCEDNFRRSKTSPEIQIQHPKSKIRTHGSSRGRIRCTCIAKSLSPKVASGLESCLVDKKADVKETHENQWLRSLCAQPVEEILDKYRRQTDFIRTHTIWSRTFTTPGEKSLLSVWDINLLQRRCQKKCLKSVNRSSERVGDVPFLDGLQNQRERHLLKSESRARDIREIVTGSGDKLPSPYLRKVKELNGFSQDDSRHTRKTLYMLQNAYNSVTSKLH